MSGVLCRRLPGLTFVALVERDGFVELVFDATMAIPILLFAYLMFFEGRSMRVALRDVTPALAVTGIFTLALAAMTPSSHEPKRGCPSAARRAAASPRRART